MDEKTKDYFSKLGSEINKLYGIAREARKKNYDPEDDVEAVPAGDLAARVEGLVGPPGIAAKIKLYGRGNLSKIIDSMLDLNSNRPFSLREPEIEQALRTSLAILTEGVVAAPIEGISGVKVNKNPDGSEYLSIYFAGPIRSAGGTAQGQSVLVGDYIRTKIGLREYRPTGDELERYVEEIKLYHERASRLQYQPSDDDVRTIVKSVPVCVDGDPTEEFEVAIHRDLQRIGSNRIRGGMCLVIAEGIAQKSRKVMSYAKNLGLDWNWLAKLGQAKDVAQALEDEEPDEEELKHSAKFMGEVVGGRPIFAAPSAKGGFRLRYGRARSSGIAAKCIHPATMIMLDDFIATGTQVKIERPGKGCIMSECDTVEGPTVKLKDGSVELVETRKRAEEIKNDVVEILFLGDILVSYGDFLQTNTPLLPSGYCEEWWKEEAKNAGVSNLAPNGREAVEISASFGIPLHPKYTYHWEDVNAKELKLLVDWICSGNVSSGLTVPDNNPQAKRVLEILGIPHKVFEGNVIVLDYQPLLSQLGIKPDNISDRTRFDEAAAQINHDSFQMISKASTVKIRRKVGVYIGCRMGRPEKAKERKMEPPVHALFPIGNAGGRMRSINQAAEKNTITIDSSSMLCNRCNIRTISNRCPVCNGKTTLLKSCPSCNFITHENSCPRCKAKTKYFGKADIELGKMWKMAVERVGRTAEVKGVIGMISEYKVPEPLEKGLLRAIHNVFVFKDGTTRFDATDAPLTHFKPREIGVSLEKLKELGYTTDYLGSDLNSVEQIVELNVQDIIIPTLGAEYLIRVSAFIDELLVKLYGTTRFYNANSKEDLLGHLVIGLAPHTSAGVVGRIVGFTKARVCYAHPFWHAAKRRNCLSSETSVLLLNSSTPEIANLKELYDNTGSPEELADDFGTLRKRINGIKTLAFDKKSGKFAAHKVDSVIKTPSPKHLIEVKTESGRIFTASQEHRLLTHSKNGLAFKKVVELNAGDSLLTPKKLAFRERDVKEIDLLEEFLKTEDLEDALMVRGIRRLTNDCTAKLGGLRNASEKLGVGKKTFSDYLYRDSIPATLLMRMLKICGYGRNRIPKTCSLGAKRNEFSIPRIIKADAKFMRLIGYYIAEGYSRSAERCHQVTIATTEDEIRKDVIDCVKSTFRITPSHDDRVVVISNRLVYSLFQNILKTGSGAKEKRIPQLFTALPKKKMKELLRAYFSGDGSVEKDRLHVICSSASRQLLSDIGLQLLRFGIFYRMRTEKRRAGGAAGEFYARKGRNPIFEHHYIAIRSSYASLFRDKIGFSLKRKQAALESAVKKEGTPRVAFAGDAVLDPVKEITPKRCSGEFLYDLEVSGLHNFLINDFTVSGNCDGDEDAFMLLLDVLLNFSRKYLPEKRGGKMDAPLVISTLLDPKEIDDEAHKMEIVDHYPLEFYEKTWTNVNPGEVEIKIVRSVLNTNPYNGLAFTNDTWDVTGPVLQSRYVTLGTMKEKIDAQLKVAEKIRAIDERDVAELVINSHFLRDTYGNLRAFARQHFRCVQCNQNYRRVPLAGKCTKCGGRLLLTVSEGNILKYLGTSMELAEKYHLSDYLKQRLTLVKTEVDSLFKNELKKQYSLADYM